MVVSFTAQHLLHLPFLGSIRFGIRCAPIPLSKNFAKKEQPRVFTEDNEAKERNSLTEGNEDNEGFRLDNSESLFPLLASVKPPKNLQSFRVISRRIFCSTSVKGKET